MNNKKVGAEAGKCVGVNLGENPRRNTRGNDTRGKGMATSGIHYSVIASKGTGHDMAVEKEDSAVMPSNIGSREVRTATKDMASGVNQSNFASNNVNIRCEHCGTCLDLWDLDL